jgi:hypothetical protein
MPLPAGRQLLQRRPAAGRAAFEAVPWVRHAVVRRVWPDRLACAGGAPPVALWQAEERWRPPGQQTARRGLRGQPGRRRGRGAARAQPAPRAAPRDAGAATAAAAAAGALELTWTRCTLSGRGSWRAELDTGAVIELGRGSEDELVARTERFVRTLAAGHRRAGSSRWSTPTCATPTAMPCAARASPPPRARRAWPPAAARRNGRAARPETH